MRAVVCWEEQPMTPSSWLVALPSKWTTTLSSSRSAGEGGPVRMSSALDGEGGIFGEVWVARGTLSVLDAAFSGEVTGSGEHRR
jgi:hypothetical protein